MTDATLPRPNRTAIVLDLIVNVALPYAIYTAAAPHVGEVGGLLWASAPPIAWSVIEFARCRRLDAISLLSIAGIALSLLALLGGGGAQWLQLREKLVSAIVALAMLGSAAIGRPLLLVMVKAGAARAGGAVAERLNAKLGTPGFQRAMTLMTVVWGLGLLADVALSVALLFVLSVKAYLLVNPILGYAVVGALSLWAFRFARANGLNG